MSRDIIIAILVSILLHGGIAGSGYLFKEKPAPVVKDDPTPTIEVQLPPPPEPEEPEVLDAASAAEPGDVADLAPPMQTDVPVAATDAAFQQQWKPAPPQINPSGDVLRTIPPTTRPASTVGVGKGLGNLFDLAALDKRPVAVVQPVPPHPFELKRAGIEGEVMVGFIVDATGAVRDPYIIRSSNPGFEDTVLNTVRKWRFRPGEKGGAVVNTRVQMPIAFNLSGN